MSDTCLHICIPSEQYTTMMMIYILMDVQLRVRACRAWVG